MVSNFKMLFTRSSDDVSCVWQQMGVIFSIDCEHVVYVIERLVMYCRNARTMVTHLPERASNYEDSVVSKMSKSAYNKLHNYHN